MTKGWDGLLNKLQSTQKRPDGVSNREWGRVLKALNSLNERKDKDFDPDKHKAQTQADLAKLFINYYFLFISGVLIFILVYNLMSVRLFSGKDTIGLRDGFMMVSSTITPILTFILGHYFKGKD
jgi:hypothetical protein